MVKKVKALLSEVNKIPAVKKMTGNPLVKDISEVAGNNKKKLLATFAPPVVGAVAAGSLFAFLFYRHRKKIKNQKEDNMLKCETCGAAVITNQEDLFKQCEGCGEKLVKVKPGRIKKVKVEK